MWMPRGEKSVRPRGRGHRRSDRFAHDGSGSDGLGIHVHRVHPINPKGRGAHGAIRQHADGLGLAQGFKAPGDELTHRQGVHRIRSSGNLPGVLPHSGNKEHTACVPLWRSARWWTLIQKMAVARPWILRDTPLFQGPQRDWLPPPKWATAFILLRGSGRRCASLRHDTTSAKCSCEGPRIHVGKS